MPTAAEAIFNHLQLHKKSSRTELHAKLTVFTNSAIDMGIIKLERLGYLVREGEGKRNSTFKLANRTDFDPEQIRDRRGRTQGTKSTDSQEARRLTAGAEGESLSSLMCALFAPIQTDDGG